ncbi:DNA-packaging protein FI [Brenneria populi subsp. brevivirga]|uniref:DNA-packaging protein FI n=1 Tax=Brenneria populi TaxID=1505588 RepID=UPI002E19441F|nr:DNA-packaging protein FI [Brenneria populi subsp. brevivirga]
MTKAELIERLKVLGEQLGREVLLTGTVEELSLRVAELEEELGGDSDSDNAVTDNTTGDNSDDDTDNVVSDDGLVKVVTLTTLHIHAQHEFDDTIIPVALAGSTIRLPAAQAEELRKLKLVK